MLLPGERKQQSRIDFTQKSIVCIRKGESEKEKKTRNSRLRKRVESGLNTQWLNLWSTTLDGPSLKKHVNLEKRLRYLKDRRRYLEMVKKDRVFSPGQNPKI